MSPRRLATSLLVTIALLNATAVIAAPPTAPQASIQRATGDGRAQLVLAPAVGVRFEVTALCRYDAEARSWRRQSELPVVESRQAAKVTHLPEGPGLYWVQWRENGRAFARLVASGGMLCNDLALGPPPFAGAVAACIPREHGALAAFVPDPAASCQ